LRSHWLKLKSKFPSFAILILFTGFILEGISYLGERYLAGKGIIYKPPILERDEGYLLKRDPQLGWPSPDLFGKEDYDSSGSRMIPSFPDPNEKACVSLYGDSFTWGTEVSSEFAWSNVLSKILNCRVSNFGVRGYGTDQSYLRFKHNDRDKAKIVILGHLSENIVRNVNQFINLLYPRRGYGLKPRFVIAEDGSLKLIPLPNLSLNDYHSMVQNPERFVLHEYLLPGGPTGTSKAGFPYTLSIFKAFNNYRIKARLVGKSFWADFYRRGHPSEALEITTLIMKSFYQEARARGRVPVIVIFPLPFDLMVYQRSKSWDYQTLIDNLHESNIAVLNIGTSLAKELSRRDPCDLFTTCHGGHFNEEGNRVVAKLIGEYLMKSNVFESSEISEARR
jgi:hypothetical protein